MNRKEKRGGEDEDEDRGRLVSNKLAILYPSFISHTSLSCLPYMRHASKRLSCHLICYWSVQISAIYFRLLKIREVFAGLNTQYLFLECVWGGGCCLSGSTPFQKTWYQFIPKYINAETLPHVIVK